MELSESPAALANDTSVWSIGDFLAWTAPSSLTSVTWWNTIEGKVLDRLLSKLQDIRDTLDDDAVFNVIGEILPATQP